MEKKETTEIKIQIHDFNRKLFEQVDELAKETYRTRSQMVAYIISKALEYRKLKDEVCVQFEISEPKHHYYRIDHFPKKGE
jgi:metal-responsive CopG/Arc/MetJ family transcriptional regulator